MSRISWAITITALLAGTMGMAQSTEPSLADIARQRSTVKAKHVVTNEEIPPSPAATEPLVSKADAKTDSKPKEATDPAAKAAAVADPQARLQALTKDNQDLQKIIEQLQAKIDASEDKALIKTLGETVQHAKKMMEQNDADIAKLKATGVTLAAADNAIGSKPAAPPSTGTTANTSGPSK